MKTFATFQVPLRLSGDTTKSQENFTREQQKWIHWNIWMNPMWQLVGSGPKTTKLRLLQKFPILSYDEKNIKKIKTNGHPV